MNNIYDFVRRWLIERKIKTHFNKDDKYIKLKESDLIDFCIKFINTIEDNT